MKEHVLWNSVTSHSESTKSLDRNIPLAIFLTNDLTKLLHRIAENTKITQNDDVVDSFSVVFNLVLAMLIQGNRLDELLGDKFMYKVPSHEIPLHAVTSLNFQTP